MCFVDRSCLNVYDADENIFFFLEIASLIGPICSAFSPPLPPPPPPTHLYPVITELKQRRF